jgi:hypothetical protein
MTLYDLTEGDATIQLSDSWWIAQFNDVIRQAATANDALVADVAEGFKGRISEYTHQPYDVHPTNSGHLAIAQAIWSVLGFDDQPPAIDAEATLVADRLTPTIPFTVTDNVGVSTVTVTSDDVALLGPYETDDDRYAVLVDLNTSDREEVALTIEIGDDAGNVTRQEITVTSTATIRSESE